jgi:cytochrome b561
MPWLNTPSGYGAISKFLHWAVVVLIALQFMSAGIMLGRDPGQTTFGLSQGVYYNWHKSLGLLALVVAILRLLARRSGQLPDWAETLSVRERVFIHHCERVLYAAMFAMPISGYLHVMAGEYGVNLFGVVELDNPIAGHPLLAAASAWTHGIVVVILGLALAGHVGLVLWHQFVFGDRLLQRMLPGHSGSTGPR